MKLFEMFNKNNKHLNESKWDRPLQTDLIAYPNVTFDRNQATKIPSGTMVDIAVGGDLSRDNIIKFVATIDGKPQVWFTWSDDYFEAVHEKTGGNVSETDEDPAHRPARRDRVRGMVNDPDGPVGPANPSHKRAGQKARRYMKRSYGRDLSLEEASDSAGVIEGASNTEVEYGVYPTGGSIGANNSKPYKTFNNKTDAQEYAKRMRKQLSKGERGYYKMNYIVRPIKPVSEDGKGEIKTKDTKVSQMLKKARAKYSGRADDDLSALVSLLGDEQKVQDKEISSLDQHNIDQDLDIDQEEHVNMTQEKEIANLMQRMRELERNKPVAEADIGKAIKKGIKSVKRGMAGWDSMTAHDQPHDSSEPYNMVNRHAEMSTDTLKQLQNKPGSKVNGHSPAALQQKLIKRNLRKRGERDFEKYMDEAENPEDWSPAKQETMMRLRSSGGKVYDKATLVKGDETAVLASNGNVKFAIFPDGKFKRAKQFIDFQRDGWEIEMNLGEEIVPYTEKEGNSAIGASAGEFYDNETGEIFDKTQIEKSEDGRYREKPYTLDGEDEGDNTWPADDEEEEVDNINYKLLAQKIEDAVQSTFPDADPFDQLMKYEDQLERNGTTLIDALNKAANDYLGAEDYNDFLAGFWDDHSRDNPDMGGRNPWRESIGEATRETKQNWFNTLNAALESEGLLSAWEMSMSPISYGENRSWNAQDDNGEWKHISIYRETDGRYERPVHYATKIREDAEDDKYDQKNWPKNLQRQSNFGDEDPDPTDYNGDDDLPPMLKRQAD
jgi:hypothetical protein